MRSTNNNPFPGIRLCARICAILVLGIGAPMLSAQSRNTVSVSPETIVEADRVELGKISRITGDPAAAEKLARISLGYSPNIGATREIGRAQIVLALAAAGYSENDVKLETPAKMVIGRGGQTVSEVQIREAVESGLKGQFASARISIKALRITVPQKIQVPVGVLDIRVKLSGARNMFEPFSLPIEIRVDGKAVKSFGVMSEIEAYADVLVAAGDLTANSRIALTDVRVENRRLDRPYESYITDADGLRGMSLLKNVAAGEAITADKCVAGVVIKFGDTVSVEAISGRLKIIINAEARGSGKIGDHIAVKNLQSGAILQAVILDEGRAKVIF